MCVEYLLAASRAQDVPRVEAAHSEVFMIHIPKRLRLSGSHTISTETNLELMNSLWAIDLPEPKGRKSDFSELPSNTLARQAGSAARTVTLRPPPT